MTVLWQTSAEFTSVPPTGRQSRCPPRRGCWHPRRSLFPAAGRRPLARGERRSHRTRPRFPLSSAAAVVPTLTGGAPPGAAALEAQRLRVVRRSFGPRRGLPYDAVRGGDGPDRAVGLRQVDVPTPPQPDARACPRGRDGRRDTPRRRGHLRRPDACPGHPDPNRHGFSKTQSLPGHEHPRQRPDGAEAHKIGCGDHDALVELSLQRAGLWREVRDRTDPGRSLSGGQQQRLCIARSLAVAPNVLLMDEPCSALDPTSTGRVEETIKELRGHVTVVIVTHNMQQALRVQTSARFSWPRRISPDVCRAGPHRKDVRFS